MKFWPRKSPVRIEHDSVIFDFPHMKNGTYYPFTYQDQRMQARRDGTNLEVYLETDDSHLADEIIEAAKR